MLNSNDFLKNCETLKNKGIEFEIKAGQRIARGFADLGYEEFYLLPNNKLVSLFTGKISELQENHKNFFFVVPTIDDLLTKLALLNIQVEKLLFNDDDQWQLTYNNEKYHNNNLYSLLINILIKNV